MAEGSTPVNMTDDFITDLNITNVTIAIDALQYGITTDGSSGVNKVVDSYLISADTARVIETVVQAGILPMLVLCGVIMNVVNMAVFWRQGLSDRINICLFSLAVSDSGYLLLLFSSRVYSLLTLADSSVGQYWKARSLVMVGLYAGFLNTSNVLTLLVSLDRGFCVSKPLKAKTLISARHTAVVVTAVFTICLSCSVLVCFKYDITTYVDPATNVTHYRPILTSFYRRNRDVIDGVFQYGLNVVVPTVSLLGVMAATSLIIVHMRRSRTWRKQMSRSTTTQATSSMDRREIGVSRMLVMVCVAFTLCTIPNVTFAFVRNLVPGFLPSGRYTNAFYVSNCLMHLLSCINSSVNFIIYYFMGSRFRMTLKQLLVAACFLKGKKDDQVGNLVSLSEISGSSGIVKVNVVSQLTEG